MDLEERQLAAIALVMFLLVVPTVAIAVPLGVASGWVALIGEGKHLHAWLWAWLSQGPKNRQEPALWIGFYLASVGTAYLLYQVGEIVAFGVRSYKHALTFG